MENNISLGDFHIIELVLRAAIEKGGIIPAESMLAVSSTYAKVTNLIKTKKQEVKEVVSQEIVN